MKLITSGRFEDHLTPPGHPERPERAEVMHVVARAVASRGGVVAPPREATDEELARVHDAHYLAHLKAQAGRAVMLDADTFTSPESWEVARLAAGAAAGVVDHVLDGPPGARAFALVRPPGHHAERDRAMGFCLFNNVAVAAAQARARGVARVAVVDFDVHHGNGTQAMFYADPSVLYLSTHQYPFYPGTGGASEIGAGAGQGTTANLPLDAGATDADYDHVFRAGVVPLLRDFHPGLILVSAGFDAHEADPLAGMRMSVSGFARLAAHLCAAADACCDGRIGFVTEGGYDTAALAASLTAVIAVIDGTAVPDVAEPLQGPTRRGEAAVAALRQHLAAHRPGVI